MRRFVLRTSVSMIGLLPAIAGAQDSDIILEDVPLDLGTVVVSGELIERRLQENPTSVTVIRGEDLERRGDQSLKQTINEAPNVTVVNTRGLFVIRGIPQNGLGGGGQGQLISTQIDGVALPGNRTVEFGPYSTWDLDQVEILRGPQSTQQGRNALAGAIVMRSNDPTYDQEFKLRSEAGSFRTFGGSLMFNTPLVEDKLAFRFSIDSRRSDGFTSNPTLGVDDFDFLELDTARAKLRWDPTDDVEVILSYARNRHFRGEQFIDAASFPADRVNFADIPTRFGVTSDSFGLRVNYDINSAWRLESETTYFDGDYSRVQDNDGTAAPLGIFRQEGPQKAFEQDLRLRLDVGNVEAVVGLFFADTDVDNASDADFDACSLSDMSPVPIPCSFIAVQRDNSFRTEIQNYAVYGEADIDASAWLDGLSFTIGARYDYEEQKTRNTEMTRTTPPPAALPFPFNAIVAGFIPADADVTLRNDYQAFLPKAGVTYDWTDDISTSYTVQRGYRSGGISLNNQFGNINEFDPEFTWNHEIALRSQFYDDRLTANANIFYTDWSDQQVQVEGASGLPLDFNTVNAGSSSLWGFELGLEGQPTNELSLFGNLGYVKTEFDNFVSNGQDFSGNRFPFAPEWTGAIGGSYTFNNGVFLTAEGVYTDDSFSDAGNDPTRKNDDRFVVNASIGYEEDNWNAILFARNLFDEDYLTSIDQGIGNARAGEPLTVGLIVNVTF